MIINVRGTHGSGKSTIIRNLLERYPTKTVTGATRKFLGYIMDTPYGEVYVVGDYSTACGGCDGIQPYSEIWPRVVAAHEVGCHVLFEGALVSSSYGNIGKDSEVYGDQFVFAFLDTPLQVCLDRIQARRAARGNTKPLNPKSTTDKHRGVARSIDKIRDVYKRRYIILDYRKPIPQLLRLLKNG